MTTRERGSKSKSGTIIFGKDPHNEFVDEREIFGGAIISMAEELGIAVDTTQKIYRSLLDKRF
jgi:hypothetical protein